jgi:hypothetical protein
MKKLILILPLIGLMACKKQNHMDNKNFIAQRVSKTATISVNGKIENIFPLFGAFEERKWADGWNPTLIYPSTEIMMEGTTFKTDGHGHGHTNTENEFLWRVSKLEPEKFLVQYLVSTENRYWTITVSCTPASNDTTNVTITYSYIGLNNLGNEINAEALEKMYANNLKDWEKALNYFLEKGKALKE